MFDMKPAGKAFRDSLKHYGWMVKAYSLSGMVIEIAIAILVLAILVGTIAFPIFFGTNTTNWGAQNILIWGVVPTVSLAVVIIGLVKYFRHGGAE
jgi:ABC-type proline/glycine betaine transport system permease subunit